MTSTSSLRAASGNGSRAPSGNGSRSTSLDYSRPLRSRRNKDPLAAPEFATLRSIKRLLAEGGLPSQSSRTPMDEARITAFFTLQELLHILNEFRNAHLRGTRCRLAVSENGRSPGRVTIEIAIVEETL